MIFYKVSKMLQSSTMCIDSALKQLKCITQYFGFSSSLSIAKVILTEVGIEPLFPVKHRATRKKQFDESDCQEEILEAKKAFRVKYFNVLVDTVITSLNDRFKELMHVCDIDDLRLGASLGCRGSSPRHGGMGLLLPPEVGVEIWLILGSHVSQKIGRPVALMVFACMVVAGEVELGPPVGHDRRPLLVRRLLL